MPRQGQFHTRAPRGHMPPFLVRIVWGRMQYAPTLPADRGDLHSFALVGNHFRGEGPKGVPKSRGVLHTPHPMPRQGQLHLRAPSGHTLPFLVWNIGGVCFCAPTLPADRGDRHLFAAIGYHFIGAFQPHAAVPCSEHLGAYAIRPYPDGRQRQLPFIRRRREPFYGRMTQRCPQE